MSSSLSLLLVLIPLLPALAALVARRASASAAARLTVTAAALAAALALVGSVAGALHGPQVFSWAPAGRDAPFALTLRLDLVSAIMALLVSFVGLSVLRFSRHYLAGDPGQARFFSWLSLTLAAVLTLVLSGHLLVLLTAWMATSLSLHRLLLHYPERAGAVFSARKKFVVSRLADLSLLTAALLLYRDYQTWDFAALFERIAAHPAPSLPWVGLLLVACASLKSAQFPFHSWLPDTMETPTPVSAFMHAGIINAGGFLIIRLAPLFEHAPHALHLLALIGAVTAAFGAVVMLAQPSVKRALAFSTIAQMGFMLLQCGLGAYGLALLHLVAHSLYKAQSFLLAGSTIGTVPRAAVPLRTSALGMATLTAGLLLAGAATAWQLVVPGPLFSSALFAGLIGLALIYGLARSWSAGGGVLAIARSIAVAGLLAVVSIGLHLCSHHLGLSPAGPVPTFVTIAVAAIFGVLFVFQVWLWRAGHHALGRRLYVHALNGFYVGTHANRFLGWLWPQTASK